MKIKGTLTVLILKTLERGPAHGYKISKSIRERSEGILDFKEGTLYPTLHGLEHKGLITSYEELENGRTRRCYKLTGNGEKVLADEKEEWDQISGAIKLILEGT